MSGYRLYIDGAKTEVTTSASRPGRGLTSLCDAAGLTLVDHDGRSRYGHARDGANTVNVSALTEPWSRAHYADARTTRL